MISPDIISLPFYLLYIMATVDLSLGCTLKSHGSLKKIPIPNICPDVIRSESQSSALLSFY